MAGGFFKKIFHGANTQKEEKTGAAKSMVANKSETLVSPLAGEVVALSGIKDEAFASGVLGQGLGIIPSEGKLFAPCDGTIGTFFPTGHAIGITTEKGAEILMHVGMDTVSLNGDGFEPKKMQGDTVKKGELLLEFDIEKIKAAGLDITTPIVITNTDDYTDVIPISPQVVTAGDDLIKLL